MKISFDQHFNSFYFHYKRAIKFQKPFELVKYFDGCTDDLFYRTASNYFRLQSSNSFLNRPCNFWSNTDLARLQYEKALNSIVAGFTRSNITFSRIPRILDIGCGDGDLTFKILKMIKELSQCEAIEVTLMETNTNILEIATRRLDEHPWISYKLVREEANLKTVSKIVDDCEFDLVNMASVFHEFRYLEKIRLLSFYFKRVKSVMITELEGNHDLEESFSKKLVESAFLFYYNLVNCIASRRRSIELERFLLLYIMPEFSDIIFKDYSDRRNYHLDNENWKNLYFQTGWTHNTEITQTKIDNFSFLTSLLYR